MNAPAVRTSGVVSTFARLVVAVLLAPACGRIHFDERSDAHEGSDAQHGDAMGDSGMPATIEWVKAFAAVSGSGGGYTFPIQATAAGDAVVLHSGCNITSGTTSGFLLSAPGWTFIQLTALQAQGTLRGETWYAIAPNTTATTATASWGGSVTCTNWNLNADEFTNNDPAGALVTFEASNETAGTNDCTATITTTHDHDAIWAACTSSGALNGEGTGYTQGTNDSAGDHSEYKVTMDPAGTVETATFANPGQSFVMGIVAIKPRAL